MNKSVFGDIFIVWFCAIYTKATSEDGRPKESFQDFFNCITKKEFPKEDIEKVSQCFDWDEIERQIKGLKE